MYFLDKGLSPIVTSIFILAIAIAGITVVLNIGMPAIEDARESIDFTNTKQNMRLMKDTISSASLGEEGTSRRITLTVENGEYRFNQTEDKIIYERNLDTDFLPSGICRMDGDLRVKTLGSGRALDIRFEHLEGDTVYDCGPFNNHGTFQPNRSYGINVTEGKIGDSLELNGSKGYVEVSDDSSLDTFDEITITSWINLKRPRDQMSDSNPSLIDHENLNNGGYILGWYSTDPSNLDAIGLRINNNSDSWENKVNVTTTNEWVHVTTTYNESHISLYIDGVLESTKKVPDITIADVDGTVNMGDGFEGKIDELRIYDQSLSKEQVETVQQGSDFGSPRKLEIEFSPERNNITSSLNIGRGTHSLLFKNRGHANDKTKIEVRRL